MPSKLRASGVFSLPATLTVDVRLGTTGVNVTVRGEVDVHTAPVLRDRLDEAVGQGEPRVVVHLDGVSFIDSTGLGVLVAAQRVQRASGGSLELVCSRRRVLRILELTGLHTLFTIHAGTPS
jgi:anti-sigma B factor antagonist